MVKADLITGFLGSGKTTFMKKYVRYLMNCGEKVCILENDFGAVNVDTMLLGELMSDGCGMEMVSGACDKDCHKRRFKTKLIAMAMSGYTRVVIEPSGIFDVDEFFDTLREPPLDKWYSIGSVVAIADPTMKAQLSAASDYLLASQAASAGALVFSHCDTASDGDINDMLDHISAAIKKIRCERDPRDHFICTPWDKLNDTILAEIASSGYHAAEFVKYHNETQGYGSVYFLDIDPALETIENTARCIFEDKSCGRVFRIKGFTKCDGNWFEINAVSGDIRIKPINVGQSVIIVIGENLNKENIGKFFKAANVRLHK